MTLSHRLQVTAMLSFAMALKDYLMLLNMVLKYHFDVLHETHYLPQVV